MRVYSLSFTSGKKPRGYERTDALTHTRTKPKYFKTGSRILRTGTYSEGKFAGWAPGQERMNRFIFIGRNLDRSELEAGFKACIVK